MGDQYKDRSEIEAVVKGFESCTTAKDDFTHRSHLTVAAFYLLQSNEVEATKKMRDELHRFLDHHGVGNQKFHETLTIFWIKTVQQFLSQLEAQGSLVVKTNAVVEYFGESRFVREYYSEEILRSDEARQRWVEPDLKPLST